MTKKRSLDLAAAGIGFVVLSPIMVLIALFIALQRDGPVLFAQRRIGQGGQPFTCYKFRTMAVGTPQVATHTLDGSSITPVGAILRRTKLDELPQLWNVLRGEMSLVGPRPCLPTQRALISARQAHGVSNLKPGITGLAQVRGIDMRDPERLAQIDAEYGRRAGLALDLSIIAATLLPFLARRL